MIEYVIRHGKQAGNRSKRWSNSSHTFYIWVEECVRERVQKVQTLPSRTKALMVILDMLRDSMEAEDLYKEDLKLSATVGVTQASIVSELDFTGRVQSIVRLVLPYNKEQSRKYSEKRKRKKGKGCAFKPCRGGKGVLPGCYPSGSGEFVQKRLCLRNIDQNATISILVSQRTVSQSTTHWKQ